MNLDALYWTLRDLLEEAGPLVAVLLLAGLLPGGLAIARGHRFKWIILFLGCTLVFAGFLPWIVAIVWALWPKATPLAGRRGGWPGLSFPRDFGEPALAGAPAAPPTAAPTAAPTAVQASGPIGFAGERHLASDAYRLFLLRKYRPRRDEALGVFVACDRAFASLEQALVHLAAVEAGEAAAGAQAPDRPDAR